MPPHPRMAAAQVDAACARSSRRSRRRRTRARSCAGARAPRSLPPAVLDVARLRGRARVPRGARPAAPGRRLPRRSSSCAARVVGDARRRRRAPRGAQRASSRGTCSARSERKRHLALRRLVDGAHRDPRRTASIPSATACSVNGRALPLRHRRGRASTSAACASAPGPRRTALHPHLGIHHPLRFDVIDLVGASARSAPAPITCGIPRAARYDAPPLTRFEAAARRAQRFTLEGPAPWPVACAQPAVAHRDSPTRSTCAATIRAAVPRAEDMRNRP